MSLTDLPDHELDALGARLAQRSQPPDAPPLPAPLDPGMQAALAGGGWDAVFELKRERQRAAAEAEAERRAAEARAARIAEADRQRRVDAEVQRFEAEIAELEQQARPHWAAAAPFEQEISTRREQVRQMRKAHD
jgi:colicin import membrane protein